MVVVIQGVNIRNYSLKEVTKDVDPLVLRQWMKSNLSFIPPVTVGERAIEVKVQTLWKLDGVGPVDNRPSTD